MKAKPTSFEEVYAQLEPRGTAGRRAICARQGVGERLGRFDDRLVPKGCTSPCAPEWIAAVLARKK